MMDREAHHLPDAGWCPNSHLPLLIYRNVESGTDLARRMESRFAANGWPPAWRYTIYDYAHFHSTTHEAIGVYRGTAKVCFGDRAGITVDLHPGDMVLIPAGVSHERLEGSDDFHVVGAYPENCRPDLLTKDNVNRAIVDANLRRVAIPRKDPVTGNSLAETWTHSTA